MSGPEREDLLIQDSLWPPDDYRKVTDAEFDAIARQQGYVKLEGIDVEALREALRRFTSFRPGVRMDNEQVMVDAVSQVLAALDKGADDV